MCGTELNEAITLFVAECEEREEKPLNLCSSFADSTVTIIAATLVCWTNILSLTMALWT